MANVKKLIDYFSTFELISDGEKKHFQDIGRKLLGSYIGLAGISLGILITFGTQSLLEKERKY